MNLAAITATGAQFPLVVRLWLTDLVFDGEWKPREAKTHRGDLKAAKLDDDDDVLILNLLIATP